MDCTLAHYHPPAKDQLPENAQWTNRFQIRSASSNRIYIVAMNKSSKKWACSCPGWVSRRYCKHLLKGLELTTSQIHGYGQIGAKRETEKVA